MHSRYTATISSIAKFAACADCHQWDAGCPGTARTMGAGLVSIGIPPTAGEFIADRPVHRAYCIVYVAFWLNLCDTALGDTVPPAGHGGACQQLQCGSILLGVLSADREPGD
ncbi:MAG: hypothetical protein MZV63_32955 [Marinilabiliales bacterium]|nr:hypothetical protein [Marinilabiliales bacterium]